MSQFSAGHAYLLENPWHFLSFIVLVFVVLVLSSAFSLVWGLTTVIGIVFLVMAFIIVALGRGGGALPGLFLITIVIGTIFLLMGALGVDLMTVDLSFLPGSQAIHSFFN